MPCRCVYVNLAAGCRIAHHGGWSNGCSAVLSPAGGPAWRHIDIADHSSTCCAQLYRLTGEKARLVKAGCIGDPTRRRIGGRHVSSSTARLRVLTAAWTARPALEHDRQIVTRTDVTFPPPGRRESTSPSPLRIDFRVTYPACPHPPHWMADRTSRPDGTVRVPPGNRLVVRPADGSVGYHVGIA